MQNDAGTCQQDWHKSGTECSGKVLGSKTENPGALAGATGAIVKAGGFQKEFYCIDPVPATASTLQIASIMQRFGISRSRARLVASLFYGEV